MFRGYKVVRELVHTNPLPLLAIKDKTLIRYANSLLPYSIGIEIECSSKPEFINDSLRKHIAKRDIPYIIEVNFDSYEQRFRIPSGIKGFICLYHISEFLKKYCEMNMGSGNHYHVDMTDMPIWSRREQSSVQDREEAIIRETLITMEKGWILKTLKKEWDYKGTYNKWDVETDMAKVLSFNTGHMTAEFRLGEMTFDYALLTKRILNCTNIVHNLKAKVRILKAKQDEQKADKEGTHVKKEKIDRIEEVDGL